MTGPRHPQHPSAFFYPLPHGHIGFFHLVLLKKPAPRGFRRRPPSALDSRAQLLCGFFRQSPELSASGTWLAPLEQVLKTPFAKRFDPLEDAGPGGPANVGNFLRAVLAASGEPDAQQSDLAARIFFLPEALFDLSAQVRPAELELSCAHDFFLQQNFKKSSYLFNMV